MELIKIIIFSSFFILIGIVIWKRTVIDFIAGYKKQTFNNPKMLAKNIGIIIILFGVELAVLMFLNLIVVPINPLIIGILAIIHMIAILLCYVYDLIQSSKAR